MRDFSTITALMIEDPKHISFKWNPKAQQGFKEVKRKLYTGVGLSML